MGTADGFVKGVSGFGGFLLNLNERGCCAYRDCEYSSNQVVALIGSKKKEAAAVASLAEKSDHASVKFGKSSNFFFKRRESVLCFAMTL